MSKIAERQVIFGIFLRIAEWEIDGIIERSDKFIEKVAEIYSKREFVQQAVVQNENKYNRNILNVNLVAERFFNRQILHESNTYL